MDRQQIIDVWREVFPNSTISVNKGALGGSSWYCSGYLAQDTSEAANGIIMNDPLNYFFIIEEGGVYREVRLYLHTAPPEGANLVYGTAKLRKKTTKGLTPEKLLARFEQVRELVRENSDNMKNLHFNLENKVFLPNT